MSLGSDTTLTMPVAPAYQTGNCGSGSMWGGDWGAWIVLFLLFGMFGWGGMGFGGGWGGNGFNSPAGQGTLTRADLCSEFNFNNLDNAVRGVQQGLCDGFYAQNTALMNGFHGVDNAVCQLGYQTQQGLNSLSAQLANCCCETQNAIQGVRYDIATSAAATQNTIQNTTRDIIDNQTSGINAIMGKLSQMEYNGLNDKYQAALAENQALKFQASQTAQNAFITANQEAQTAELLRRLGRDCPVPAYWVQPPTPVQVPCNPCNCNC